MEYGVPVRAGRWKWCGHSYHDQIHDNKNNDKDACQDSNNENEEEQTMEI